MSILKIKDSQGNWMGVPTVKGDKGNGIQSAILNDDYTLTLAFTDGTTYKTPSIRGEKGEKGEPATDMEIHICSASEGEVNADKTLDEMLEAIAQGKNMVGYYEYNLYGDTLIMRPSFYNLENKHITFSGINVGSSGAPIDILLFDFKRTDSSIGTRIRQAI